MKRKLHQSSSSSDECDKRRDPDFYRRSANVAPRNHPKRIINKKEKNKFEVGSSTTTRSRRRKHINEEPLYGVRERRENNNEHGVRTTLVSWLVKKNLIRENAKVFCVDETFIGHVRKGGILCICGCDKIHTALEFMKHSIGDGSMSPYDNIFVAETRIHLLSLLENALISIGLFGSNSPIGNGPCIKRSDDVCIICADGGDLMCCEACKSVYHPWCMGLKGVPQGKWFCPYCLCKFCRGPCLETPALCVQCEKQCHWKCYAAANTNNVSSCRVPLCDANCREVNAGLKMMDGEPQELAEGFSWTLLRRLNVDDERLSDYKFIERHSKLALAMEVINQSFEPVTDRPTGVNMINNVVYSCRSNCIRLNFKGFYTAILEKDDEVVSVASLRIHGRKISELPFIATTERHRKQGNCRRLLSAIESALSRMKVQTLVLPSTVEKSASWVNHYGFQLADGLTTKELMEWNALTFHNSIWLQKNFFASPEKGRLEAKESSGGTSSSRILLDLNEEPPEDHES